MPTKRNGPGVFLLAVGISIALLGLLTFLAIPAAKELDLQESVDEGSAPKYGRQISVVRGATAGTLVGGALALTGWALVRKSRRMREH